MSEDLLGLTGWSGLDIPDAVTGDRMSRLKSMAKIWMCWEIVSTGNGKIYEKYSYQLHTDMTNSLCLFATLHGLFSHSDFILDLL